VKRGHGEGVETASGDVCRWANQKWMIKMKLSTVLLSSAAIIVAGAAYAADLPAKKAAPAAAPSGCAAFGAGYIQIPGGDNCMKISGFVGYLASAATTAGTNTQIGEFRPVFDFMSNTDLGTLKGQARIPLTVSGAGAATASRTFNSTTIDRAFVSINGFTAGRDSSITDVAGTGPWNYGSNLGGGTGIGMKYAMTMGTTTLTIGEEAPVIDGSSNTSTQSRPDLFAKVSAVAGPVTFNVAAVSHAAPDSGNTSGAFSGYALIGQAQVKEGPFGAAIYGGTSAGAMAYTSALPSGSTSYDYTASSSSNSKGTNVGGWVSYAAGPGTLYLNATETQATPAGSTLTTVDYIGVAYDMTVAKGFRIQPEYINTKSSSTSSANVFYLSIFRDF